jgi:hypothetical protein
MNAIRCLLLKAFINHKIKRIGKMTTLHIDSVTKKIDLTADLAGESEPLTVRASYEIVDSQNGLLFSPSNIETSREWMTVLANEFLKSQPIQIPIPAGLPSAAVKILKL